ncbi:MAG: hypothetical protein ABW215_15585 [Kibdelosporangium sp.]
MTGVLALVVGLFGVKLDLPPVAVVIGAVALIMGIALIGYWGRRQRGTVTFLIGTALVIVGAGVLGIGWGTAGHNQAAPPAGGPRQVNPPVGPTTTESTTTASVPSSTTGPVTPAPSAHSVASPPKPIETPAETPAERRKGPLIVANGHSVDFDSTEYYWDSRPENPPTADVFNNGTAGRVTTTGDVAKTSRTATWEDCQKSTNRQQTLLPGDFRQGDSFCWKTSEGRWARVRFVAINARTHDMTVDVLVWDLRRS